MDTGLDPYRAQLLQALHRHDVPAARIADTIAEVESHVADTGEDPVSAFGAPDAYAAAIAESVGARRPGFLPGRSLWIHRLLAALSFAAGGLLVSAGWQAIRSGRSPWTLELLIGSVLVLVLVLLLLLRRVAPLTDPRTGQALRVPAPRSATVVLTLVMAAAAALVAVRLFR